MTTPDHTQHIEAAETIRALRAQVAALKMGWQTECELRIEQVEHIRQLALQFKSERDALKADAARYQWLRMRVKVKKMQSVSGSVRDAIEVKTGCSFLDSPLPKTHPESYPAEQAEKLDTCIDSAMEKAP